MAFVYILVFCGECGCFVVYSDCGVSTGGSMCRAVGAGVAVEVGDPITVLSIGLFVSARGGDFASTLLLPLLMGEDLQNCSKFDWKLFGLLDSGTVISKVLLSLLFFSLMFSTSRRLVDVIVLSFSIPSLVSAVVVADVVGCFISMLSDITIIADAAIVSGESVSLSDITIIADAAMASGDSGDNRTVSSAMYSEPSSSTSGSVTDISSLIDVLGASLILSKTFLICTSVGVSFCRVRTSL